MCVSISVDPTVPTVYRFDYSTVHSRRAGPAVGDDGTVPKKNYSSRSSGWVKG